MLAPRPSNNEIEATLHRELHQREVRLKAEGSKIIKEAEKVDNYDEYQKRLTDFMDRYNELGVSALAQYVGHRKIILEFLDRAISLKQGSRSYPLERVVHQLVFPMQATSDNIAYHEQNLWMVDEGLTYHSFIASDKRLSGTERLESKSDKRPDLVMYDQKIIFGEGNQPVSSITIVEFKRPERDDYKMHDNPVTQCFELVELIRSGSFKDHRGRPISTVSPRVPAFCYILADITSSLEAVLQTLDAYPTPDNQGYYGFQKTFRIYYEVSGYDKLLRDAQKRNRVFFDKLNLLDPR